MEECMRHGQKAEIDGQTDDSKKMVATSSDEAVIDAGWKNKG